jgi:hypothetical protein
MLQQASCGKAILQIMPAAVNWLLWAATATAAAAQHQQLHQQVQQAILVHQQTA